MTVDAFERVRYSGVDIGVVGSAFRRTYRSGYSVFHTDVVQAFRPAQTADLKVRTTRE
jgi:hypothetical protein